MNTGRLDKIVGQLQATHKEADEIIDSFVAAQVCQLPPGTSFGATKARLFTGSTLDRVAALRHVKAELTK
jgi:hypothetical protein